MWRGIAWLATLVLIAIAACGVLAVLWGVPTVADHPLAPLYPAMPYTFFRGRRRLLRPLR